MSSGSDEQGPPGDATSSFTLGVFEACIGQPFRIALSDGEIELSLAEAKSIVAGRAEPAAGERKPFSLLFRGGPPDRYLPQATYSLEHAALGALPIFLVPLGPDQQGMRYEAIFT